MIIKTVILLLVYLIPMVLLAVGVITSPVWAIVLYAIGGLGMAGIGMGIMHDANHGAYTTNKVVNTFLARTLDMLGCSSDMWKLQHNVLHHTFTNIDGHDEDIAAPVFLIRFSPHGKNYKIHRFQHLYVWFFYGILTLYWTTAKDFIKAGDYYKMGLIRTRKEYWKHILRLIPTKLFYFGYTLVLPMIFAPFSPVWIIVGFLIMHLLAGLLLSVIFQLAHVMPDMQFPAAPEDNEMEENWYTHQLQTTSNFSPKSKILFWYLGGLTNQIEHHLFPNICHVHYKNLSKIVAQTAKDFKIPYHVNKTLFSAIRGHVKTLKVLGRMESHPDAK